MTAQPKIFVSIASYRDPQCQYTVKDLFEKAAHPERITVGICWQYDPEEDRDCFIIEPPYPAQVRERRVHIASSKSICWARAEVLSLAEDEDYIMQVNAHMRFSQGWDDIMIDNIKRCPTKKAVLSSMPPDFTPPDTFQDCTGGVPVMYVSQLYNEKGLEPVSLGGWIRKFEQLQNKGPFLGAFVVESFHMAPAQAFREVPFDPHIYFRGQEPVFSARLWTHGWDIYQPDSVAVYHYWNSKIRGGDYKTDNMQTKLSQQRVRHLLGIENAKDQDALAEIEKYGMGNKRSLVEYWEFAGVDLKNKVIKEKAASGYWTPFKPI